MATMTAQSPPTRTTAARRRALRAERTTDRDPGHRARALMGSALLEDDDPLPRARDRIRHLRVRIADGLDLLQLELVQEAPVPDHGLQRTQAAIENARDAVLEHRVLRLQRRRAIVRSEERRVGKGGRSRMGP